MSDKKESAAAASASAAAAPAAVAAVGGKKDEPKPLSQQQQTIRLLRSHVFIIRKGVVQQDGRLLIRVLRQLTAVRAKLTQPVLRALTKQYLPALTKTVDGLKDDASMSDVAAANAEEDLSPPVAVAASSASSEEKKGVSKEAAAKAAAEQAEVERKEAELLAAEVAEVDVYIQLLVALYAYDHGHKDVSVSLLSTLFKQLAAFNRRSLDPLSAKIYSFYALATEQEGNQAEIRNQLLLAHRTACLQHNEPGQAALSVCILRSYLSAHLYSQADTFRLKSTFPEQRSNAQTARYCYYIGRIQAVQLHYSDAFASLTQALRKAPQKAAVGFRQVCTKLLILVQLLMGDIPERSLFSPRDLRRSLAPYLALTQAVRVGDLATFGQVTSRHKEVFDRDGLESLIVRLRANVIKAGLRKINLSYSRIALADVAAKLRLDSVEDAEALVAKAVHDGVIDASIERATRTMVSREVADVYATSEPQQAFHRRVQFTMQMHQQAVKSLRYPHNVGGKTKNEWESDDDEEDEDVIAGNAPDKREEDKKKDDK